MQDANVEREHYDAQGGEAMASLFAAVPIGGVPLLEEKKKEGKGYLPGNESHILGGGNSNTFKFSPLFGEDFPFD